MLLVNLAGRFSHLRFVDRKGLELRGCLELKKAFAESARFLLITVPYDFDIRGFQSLRLVKDHVVLDLTPGRLLRFALRR